MVRFIEEISFKLRAKFNFREREWQIGGTIDFREAKCSVSERFYELRRIIRDSGTVCRKERSEMLNVDICGWT